MNFTDTLNHRYSCRKFTNQPVSDADLNKIITAALAAPLAAGDHKTSHLTVVRNPKLVEEIRKACMFIRKDGSPMDPLYGAGTIIFFSATDISEDHIEYCNAGCVIENMCLAAASLGLGSCYIWGCLRKLKAHPEVLAKLNLPEGYEILSAFVCGYADGGLKEREPKVIMPYEII